MSYIAINIAPAFEHIQITQHRSTVRNNKFWAEWSHSTLRVPIYVKTVDVDILNALIMDAVIYSEHSHE
jgi:hypothetical protein